MRILVPLDGSRLSDAVISHVRRLLRAAPRGRELHLLHVLAPGDRRLDARASARAHLGALERLLTGEGFVVRTRVATGDPVHTILERAIDERVDLVAMATHGRSGIKRWVFGSVAERVLRGCSVPLLLVNPAGLALPEADVCYRRVLLATDPSTTIESLESLATLAGSCEAEVQLLASDEAGAARLALEARGLRATASAARGDSADAILAAAAEAKPDLLALTVGPRSLLSAWPLEPRVEGVMRRSPCPVLILRAPRAGTPVRPAASFATQPRS